MAKTKQIVNDKVINELKSIYKDWKNHGAIDLLKKHSLIIEREILKMLSDCPEWEASKPIALGSWGKNQLTVMSDIDLLFLGPEKAALKVVEHARSLKIELKYRTPLDPSDWTMGVVAYDVNSLIFGKAIFASEIAVLDEQIKKIKSSRNLYKKILGSIRSDRLKRHALYFDMSGHLEPHLKLGPGGSRDITHFYILNFFRPNSKDLVESIESHSVWLHFCRQILCLFGETEHLRAQEQIEVAELLGFKHSSQMMKQTIQALNYIKIITDEQLSELNKNKNYENKKLIITNKEIKSIKPQKLTAQSLAKMFFDSDIQNVFPNWEAVNGLVKHDQYHKFSTENHIFRAVKLLCEWSKKPPAFLKKIIKTLRPQDWQTLFWAVWFHDIGKGADEDHSTFGARLALQFFKEQKLDKNIAKQVAWLVEHHLVLSTFAFRHNHHSSHVVTELKKRGIEGEDLKKLLVVTAIDIMATNPSAWSSWKEELLIKLTEHLLSPEVNRLGQLLESAQKKKLQHFEQLLEHVNETVLLDLDPKVLVNDFSDMLKSEVDMPPKLYKDDRDQLWVRFHKKEDKAGVFLEFIQKLVTAGAQVRHSVVMTLPFGVYDWFRVRSNKDIDVLQRLLRSLENSGPPKMEMFNNVKFKRVELVSSTDLEGIISFKGIDQRGALMVAAKNLFEKGLEIKWAKVNTFGSQIDDVFGVLSRPDLPEIVAEIHNKLCSTSVVSRAKNELSLD